MPHQSALFFLAVFLAGRLAAAEPQVDAAQLPRVPATPPEKALDTFKVKLGFRIELVAAEPRIVDPIAMSFDEDGRCYVVEMRDYSERRPERLGRIRRLEDTDGDGRFDKGTVFAKDLPWPTAVICWDGGVFVGATPDILYFKDTDQDGVADVREPIFTGFAGDYAPFATNKLNVQALMNSFNWSLDNRIHGATSFSGGKVRRTDSPFVRDWLKRAAALPGRKFAAGKTQNEIMDLRGRDFSFDPRTLEMRAESGGGQHGLSFDHRGRKFVCANANHAQTLMYEERYVARNPYYALPRALVDIAADGGAAPVFRLSPDEPWRVIRTQWRVAGLVSGPIEGGGRPSGYFTGATGITIYRGDAFGPEFMGDAFVGDAGGNLVHRKKIMTDGVGVKAMRPVDEQKLEFLASSDNWFRPVQMANAPDGCLYICDMYREVIEHPWSLPESIKKHLDLNSGNDQGRIYRIVPEKFRPRPPPRLSGADARQLVAYLGHANGWHRDTAARLLYQRQDKSSVPLLTRLLTKGESPFGRMHALLVLSSLGALDARLLRRALSDPDDLVRQQAVRLAEPFLEQPGSSPALARQLNRLATDADPLVRYQFAFALGSLPAAPRIEQAAALILDGESDGWTRRAVLHSLGEHGLELFSELEKRRFQFPGSHEFIPSLATLIGTQNRPEAITTLLSKLSLLPSAWLTLATTRGLAAGLETRGRSLLDFDRERKLGPVFALARDWVTNNQFSALPVGDLRQEAIAVLALAPYTQAGPALLDLLKVERPAAEQLSALAALGRFGETNVTAEVLRRWSNLSPATRAAALAMLLKRPERCLAVLHAIEAGRVQAAELSAAQVEFLRAHRSEPVRRKSALVLGKTGTMARQDAINAFTPALKLNGNTADGRKIFQARCASCHRLGGEGQPLGPDLATMKNAGKEKLLTNILDPNRELNPSYLSYSIETTDGENLVGIIAGESAISVTLRQAGGAETEIARANITSLQGQGKSLMPEGLEEGLSAQDMANLLEFIVSP